MKMDHVDIKDEKSFIVSTLVPIPKFLAHILIFVF